MARRDSLLRLRKTLLARRAELSARLAGASAHLQDFEVTDGTGDILDAAFERESGEMSAQLQDLEARELSQIERALARLQQRAYGICESCQKRIPLTRLNALPYATLCIQCEPNRETHSGGPHRISADNWPLLAVSEARIGNRRIDLSKIEMSFFGSPG